VLQEAELASRLEHAPDLGERLGDVGNRAHDEAHNGRVDAPCLEWQCTGHGVEHAHRHRCLARSLLGLGAQVALGFDRDDFLDGAGVVAEVGAVARAQLDDPARQAREQTLALLTDLALHQADEAVEEAGEDRMVDGADAVILTGSARMSELSLLGQPARFPAGLRELGDGLYAWLQPNGGLGESNAGLIVGDGESLLIDTLWDTRLTRRMLEAMAPHTARAPIRRLVNTHGDPDHCWGNQLLAGAEIIATRATADDMQRDDPRRLRLLSRVPWPPLGPLGGLRAFARLLAPFDFSGIRVTPPTATFDGRLELDVGGRRVELIEAGPAHTPGDLIVHVPDAEAVFAGDLMFVGVTPIMWVGPVENWLAGLERIIELSPRVVVPGHGPPTDLDGVRTVRGYWEFVAPAVRGGRTAREILDSLPEPYVGWDNPERISVNAAIIARGAGPRLPERARMRLLSQMGQLAQELQDPDL
jgi:cyclase